MTQTTNLAGRDWKTSDGRRAAFSSSTPAYGIVRDGFALARTGNDSPSVWDRKSIALVVEESVEGLVASGNFGFTIELAS